MTVRLLLVGRRLDALAAADRLGADVFVLDDGPVRGKAKGCVRGRAQVDFRDVESCASAARKLLGGTRPDAVVALIERAVVPAAALREALGVHGPGVERARLWRDKIAMKDRIREAGLPCADHRLIDARTEATELVDALGLPMVLKPRDASGGRGTVIARELVEVHEALADGWMAERFVHGVELSVESFVHEGRVVFENVTEYLRPGWANVVPAVLPANVDSAIRRLNRAAIEALTIDGGLTHLEAFVIDRGPDEEPLVTFGELACRPPGGALMELMQGAYGFDPWRAHLELELGRPIETPGPARRSMGVWFLHPGAGRVVAVHGIERARAVPGIRSVQCSLTVGQQVGRREGVGQHTGRIVASTSSRDATARALETAHAMIHLELESDPLAA